MYRVIHLFPVAVTFAVVFATQKMKLEILVFFIIFILFSFYGRRSFIYLPLFLLTVFLGYYLYTSNMLHMNTSHHKEGVTEVEGTIHSIPIIDGASLRMNVKDVHGEVIVVRATFRTEQERMKADSYLVGDRCKLKGMIEKPPSKTNFAQFDYRKYLHEQRINWQLQVKDNAFACYPSNQAWWPLERWRHKQLQYVESLVSPELNGIMSALLFGERSALSEDVLTAYKKLGILHLLAISGLHVGLIASALFYLMIRIGIVRERAYTILILFLPIYVVITGATPSVIRAAMMTMIVFIFLRYRLKLHLFYSIVIVYMAYVLWKPQMIYHLGFQLSFLLSFALILSARTIQQKYHTYFSQIFAVNVISQFFAFPLLLYHTYEFAWLSIPINMVYIPYMTLFILPLIFIAYFLSFFLPFRMNFPLILLEKIVPPVHDGLTALSAQKWATLITGKPHLFIVFALYGVIIYGAILFEREKRHWWLKPSFLFLSIITVQLCLPMLQSSAKITMFDVGQGDSYLIELPYRRAVYLIDAGGLVEFANEDWKRRAMPYDVGEKVLLPELKAKGIRKIDKLILSHGHYDHVGGAFALLRAIKIKEVLYRDYPFTAEFEQQLYKDVIENGGSWKPVREGISWNVDHSFFYLLGPTGNELDENNRSIVILAEIEGKRFLFTGDLEQEGELRLTKEYPQIAIDVLKVGHHGSKTSTTEELLDHFSPKVALISAGRNNLYGHPNNLVLERLQERQIKVFRSDEGAVMIMIENGAMKIRQINGKES